MPNRVTSPPAIRTAIPFAGDARRYRRFMQWAAMTCAIGAATLAPLPAPLASVLAVAAIVGVLTIAAMSLAFPRDWPCEVPPSRAAWAGVTFIVVAIVFDIAATVHHSPTLEDEANPIALALLGNGVPLAWVIGLGGIGQAALALALCMLWLNFLRRREDYLRWLLAGNTRTPLWMRLFGARTPSLTNVLLGRDGEPGVQVVALGPYALAAAGYRLWLGLEWFGWAPLSRVVAPVACVLVTFAVLRCWAQRRLRAAGPAD